MTAKTSGKRNFSGPFLYTVFWRVLNFTEFIADLLFLTFQ